MGAAVGAIANAVFDTVGVRLRRSYDARSLRAAGLAPTNQRFLSKRARGRVRIAWDRVQPQPRLQPLLSLPRRCYLGAPLTVT
jgi:hypothetical protein